MSSNARHRAPGRASTPIPDLPRGLNAKTATIAVTAAGVAISATPATAGPSVAPAKTATTIAVQAKVSTTAAAKTRSYKAAAPSKTLTPAQRMRAYRTYKHYRLYHTDEQRTYGSYLHNHFHFKSAGNSTAAAAKARTKRARVLTIMRRYQGTMYRYGGTTPSGFDCSGFTKYVYGKVGVKLPRTSSAQRRTGRVVSRAAGRPGDLVSMPGHIGIYMGNGMMYDSPRTGKAVGARKIWRKNYKLIRVIND